MTQGFAGINVGDHSSCTEHFLIPGPLSDCPGMGSPYVPQPDQGSFPAPWLYGWDLSLQTVALDLLLASGC